MRSLGPQRRDEKRRHDSDFGCVSLQELKAYQIRHAKAQIKKRAIGELAFDLRNGLPEEVSQRNSLTYHVFWG